MSDRLALLERAQQGDDDACQQMLTENAGLIWSIVRRYNGCGVETDDLYQLGCIGFVKSELSAETGFTAEEIASIDLALIAPESLQQETAEGLTLESTLGTEEPETALVEHLALRDAIDTLPERERQTILLRFFKCLTQEQTARILGVSQVQVSRLERRSLQKLREYLAD